MTPQRGVWFPLALLVHSGFQADRMPCRIKLPRFTMSKKQTPRHRHVVPASSGSSRVQLERLLLKQQYKDAVKQAKLIYKSEATPENHTLLERAYFLRVEQLYSSGMAESAVEVSRHLLDFGVTESSLV